jgi:predicted amidohydrolase YtcJ
VLPDFSAGQREQVVLHLRASPSVRSGAMDLGSYALAWQDLLANRPADARVSLAAAVTGDLAVVHARRDKHAVVAATKALAAANYQKAAEAIDRGDFGGAQAAVQQNAVLFDDAEALAGKGAVEDERAASAKMFGLSTSAPAAVPEVRKAAVKQLKVQSLKSSGRGASTY